METKVMEESHNLKNLHELCHLRSALEGFSVVRLHRSPLRAPAMKELEKLLKQMFSLAKRNDYPAFHQADMQFHRTIVDACGMKSLSRSWEIVVADLDDWLQHVKKNYWPGLMSLYREHVILLEALKSDLEWIPVQAIHQHQEAGWFRVASALGRKPEGADPVDRAAAFIATHFASDFSVSYVASNVSFVSASHLNRLFRQRLGVSLHACLKKTRLERGATLLQETGDEISRIATKVGYKSASHFIKDFRLFHKVTPLRFRERIFAQTR